MLNQIKKKLNNKTVLITGGTGSFGSKFLEKIIKFNNCNIKIFSRDELKQHDLRIKLNDKKIQFIIGDIRDLKSVEEAMRGVDYVFHAAALKQVPSCEFFPEQAVSTNILGSSNVIDAAIKENVSSIVLLSTDKAVYPINSMGMTKALMEKIALAKARLIQNKKTKISIVRYGNVLLSRGSVVPLFINQIKKNKNLTVTNKEMTRFLMPLDKAIELVFVALLKSNNGSIFIHRAKSSNILNLAKAIKEIYKSRSKINIIGNRLGEKLHEVLVSEEELKHSVKFKDYFEIKMQNTDLNYNKYFTKGQKTKKNNEYSSKISDALSLKELVTILKQEITKEKF